MSDKQIAALQAVALAVVALLVVYGVVNESESAAWGAVVAAVFAAVGAFLVKRPKDQG